MSTEWNADKLIDVYVKIRDKRSEIKKEFEEQDGKLKEQLSVIENELLRRIQAEGGTQFKSDHGLAYISESLKASFADKATFSNYCEEHDIDPLDLMESRVSTRALQEYMDEHEGKVPPGINTFRELNVRVRRPTAKS